LLLLVSCEKEARPDILPSERTADRLLIDSVVHYYRLYSLWGEGSVPDPVSVRSFSDAFESPADALLALRKATPFYPGYGGSIDRFSYLVRESAEPGFGVFLSMAAVSDEMAYPVIYLVEPGSPADRAGLRRSDVVLGVGDQDLGVPISCQGGSCTILDGAKRDRVIQLLLGALAQNNLELRLRRRYGTETSVVLSSGHYQAKSLLKDAVFFNGNRSIGYMALSSFAHAPEGSNERLQLEGVLDRFEAQDIQQLIVDLRYNNGGYIETAEFLANCMINASNDGKLMYSYKPSAYLAENPGPYNFDDVYFQRKNTLDLQSIYFLVTDKTASAAELLIHSLRPYMNVVLIAEGSGTYGKPVGFFKQPLPQNHALWIASFKLVNALGQTDYWDGIPAQISGVTEDIRYDFGEAAEPMIAAALSHSLGGGALSSQIRRKTHAPSLSMHPNMKPVNAIPLKNMIKTVQRNEN